MPRQLLRNDQWERIKDLLPGKAGDPGKTASDNRRFIEAVLWIGRTGSPWRDLHPALGNWHNTYTRLSRWGKNGVWQRITRACTQLLEVGTFWFFKRNQKRCPENYSETTNGSGSKT